MFCNERSDCFSHHCVVDVVGTVKIKYDYRNVIFGADCSRCAVHYLELLYNWRIDWAHADMYMKLRFLFDDVPHKEGAQASNRAFVALGNAADSADAGDAAVDGANTRDGE